VLEEVSTAVPGVGGAPLSLRRERVGSVFLPLPPGLGWGTPPSVSGVPAGLGAAPPGGRRAQGRLREEQVRSVEER